MSVRVKLFSLLASVSRKRLGFFRSVVMEKVFLSILKEWAEEVAMVGGFGWGSMVDGWVEGHGEELEGGRRGVWWLAGGGEKERGRERVMTKIQLEKCRL